jgi:integrase
MADKETDRPFGNDGPWLSKRGDSPNWYISWYAEDKRTKRESTRTADLPKARKLLAKWWLTKHRLNHADPAQVPLGLVLEQYYDNHAKHKKSKTQARVAVAKWKTFFGAATVGELTVARQEQFVEWLHDAGDAPNYIRRTLSVGKAALLRAVRRQELTAAPPIIMPKRKRTKKYRMTLQEAAALFNAATTDHFRLYLILAFATAQRPINVLELTTDRIDIENRIIDFNPPDHDESNKRRPVVAICNALLPWLEKLQPGIAIRWKKHQTKPMGGIKTAFIAARDRAGLNKEIMPYTIRRTMATELRRRGVSIGEIGGLLGHTQSGHEITELYAEYSPNYMSNVTAAIDAYFRDLEPLLNKPLLTTTEVEQPRPEDLCVSDVPLLTGLFSDDPATSAGNR